MRTVHIAALALIVVGVLVLVGPVISYTERDKVLDLGPVEVTTTETHTLPVQPIIGGVAAALGVALLVGSRRRAA